MRLPSKAWWIVALNTAALATLLFGILSLRNNHDQPKKDRAEVQPGPAAQGRVTAVVLNDQTRGAVRKRREEPKGGDPEVLALEALVAARKAIAQSPALAAAHFNLGLALEQLGFTPEARAEFESAASLESDPTRSAEAQRRGRELRRIGPPEAWISATRYISATASPESRTILKEYLEARERTRDRPQWNGADVNARLERAAKLYDRGVSSPELLPRVLWQVAMALSPRGQTDLYMQRYLIAGGLHGRNRSDEAIALLGRLDADAFRAHGQAGWAAQIVCEQAIHRIVRGAPEEALDLFRNAFHNSVAKGESRLATLYANLASEVRTHLLQSALRDRDLSSALEYTDASVFSSPNGHSGNVHKEQIEEIDQRRPGIKGRRLVRYGVVRDTLQVCSAVSLNDARFYRFGLIAEPKSPGEAQRALNPDAAIVEYATIRDQVIAFVIRNSDVQIVFLYASAADVRNAADAMRHADDKSFTAAAGRLYEIILAPVAARLEGVSTIVFIPYKDLVGIPFGALLDVQRGQFLIERFAVLHAQSTRAAITASRALKPAREQTTLAIAATDFDRGRYPDAPELPAARREADIIATLSRCPRLLVGPAATPEAIQRQLAENVVIHYAGHIVRRGADVWLPLMPAAGRDGLSATEIARLPLKNARVVVLAACRGASPGEADDVIPTMADAFLIAGVPAVIASSYDVDDSDAPATMRRLHTYLRDGDDAADALRKTAIDELRRGRGVPLSLRFMAIGGAASLVNERRPRAVEVRNHVP